MRNHIVATGLTVLGLVTWSSQAWGLNADPRMQVVIIHDETETNRPELRQAVEQALPVLWDRLVPVSFREQADEIPPSYKLVSRIVPGPAQTKVEFNAKAVFSALERASITALQSAPRFQLVIHMHNSAGAAMTQSQAMLMQFAEEQAPFWGVELDNDAPGLVLDWQWLADQRLMLSLRGNTRLAEFSETRQITDADPVPAVQAWLGEIILAARDAYVIQEADAAAGDAQQQPDQQDVQELYVSIDRPMPLAEQVALEQALSSDPRVRQLLPLMLSRSGQQYRLRLHGIDEGWLPEWFERRGLTLTRVEGGGWQAK